MTAATFNSTTHDPADTYEDGKYYAEPSVTDEDCQWSLWTHLGPLLAAVVSSGTLAPLAIVWGLYVMYVPGKERPFVADHAREMANFGISYLIYWTVGSIVIGAVTFGAALVVWMPFLVILGLVATIRGSIAGANGRYYRYPMCIRFLKPKDGSSQADA
ncbi:MAG: DUF4870 domain-containing protein [Planctomycetota bacterium]